MPKTNIATAHAEIARTIRLAKKRMFKAHREGGPLALEKAREAFITDVSDAISQQDILLRAKGVQTSNRTQTVEHSGESPTREHNEVADAIALLLHSDLTPPPVRDALVAHVTDAPPYREDPSQAASEPADEPDDTKDWTHDWEYKHKLVEQLAGECLQDGEPQQHMALLELLTYVTEDTTGGLALSARTAVISTSTDLRDQAADLLVAQTQSARAEERR